MLLAGTQDVALAIAAAARHFTTAVDQALWLVAADGAVVASGGATAGDAGIELTVGGSELTVAGLPASRRAWTHRCDLAGGETLWLVLTAAAESRGAADLLASLGELLARTALRDYEAEDTTEHLLSCFEQIRAVHDLADQLPLCDTLEEMVRLCLESLQLALGVRLAAAVLRQGPTGPARCLILEPSGRPLASSLITFDADSVGPVAQTLRDGKPRYSPVAALVGDLGVLEGLAHEHLMVVPICFGSDPETAVLGCLVLMDRDDASRSSRSFGSPDAELTQSVGVLLGLVLGTKLRAAAEKELQIARAIQETLIPARPPRWAGVELAGRNRSANQVGGDYFDFLESASGRKHVVIADVSGHNMASAMAMVMARTHLRSHLAHADSPGPLLAELARGLYDDLMRNDLFITCCLVSLMETGEAGVRLRLANAGHNPPLLLRGDGEVRWLYGEAPMIGFLPDPRYVEQEVLIEPGDLLVLYTDGLTEVVDPEGRMFDETGLEGAVRRRSGGAAESILDGLFAAVDAHAAVAQNSDDRTAVVIRATTPVASLSGQRGKT
jgi:hypothetical protein